MKRALLILFTIALSTSAFSQSYIGKTKSEIESLANTLYEEVELAEETVNSFKLICDNEMNEFFLSEGVCTNFKSVKSYKCDCLKNDIDAYNKNLDSVGNMKWASKDGSKIYSIELEKEQYVVSISQASSMDLASTKTN